LTGSNECRAGSPRNGITDPNKQTIRSYRVAISSVNLPAAYDLYSNKVRA